jgi:hypothetical protein
MLAAVLAAAALVLAGAAALVPAHAGSDTESTPAAAERLRASTGDGVTIRCNGTDVGRYLDVVEVYECTAPAVTAAKP